MLLAMRYAGPPLREERPLGSIVAAADAINHAVPVAREVDGAFKRLTAQGLVTVTGTSALLTEDALGMLERVRGGTWLEEWKRLTVEIEHLGPSGRKGVETFSKKDVKR